MQRIRWSELDHFSRKNALARPPRRTDPIVLATVRRVFADVAERGDDAVRDFAIEFDGAEPRHIDIDAKTIAAARATLQHDDLAALDVAAASINAYHRDTKPAERTSEPAPGVLCRQRYSPISRVGLYAPGGTAPLFSTLLMLAIPANVAGVRDIVATTPPQRDGSIEPVIIAAAALCGLDSIMLLGGAQAIAALALGTQTITPVSKIFGPGNAYVTAAKIYAASLPGGPAIDLPAGASELFIIADASADPELVAADLLSQAEHDPDAQVILATTDEQIADAVTVAITCQLEDLPRELVARAALAGGRLIVTRTLAEAVDAVNAYAPEHLALHVSEPAALVDEIENAGAIFCGALAAETFGDYVNGPSHVLPTDGAARAWSGVSVASFMRSQSVQTLSRDAVRRLGPVAARLARLEGLEAHARAALLRLQSLDRPGGAQ